MIDVIIVIVIHMQNHKCNEMENAFQIFKVSCLVRVTQIHITMVITKWFLLFPTCDKWLDPYTSVLNWWSVFVINFCCFFVQQVNNATPLLVWCNTLLRFPVTRLIPVFLSLVIEIMCFVLKVFQSQRLIQFISGWIQWNNAVWRHLCHFVSFQITHFGTNR